MKQSSREEGRPLQERRENALRDDVQEELPAAAAAAAGCKGGSTEGRCQPQQAWLVQELQGAPAGAEDRGGRVVEGAQLPPPSPTSSSSSPTPPDGGDVAPARQREGEQGEGDAGPQEHQPVSHAREIPDAAPALRLGGERQRQQLRQRHGADGHGLVPGRPGECQRSPPGQSQPTRLDDDTTRSVPGTARRQSASAGRGQSASAGGQHAVFPLRGRPQAEPELHAEGLC